MAPQLPSHITLRPYQADAIDAWTTAGHRGILAMATGTGKTITALAAATQYLTAPAAGGVLIIIAPYLHLVDQWDEEARAFGFTPVTACGSWEQWYSELQQRLMEQALGVSAVEAVITTKATFAGEKFQEQIRTLDDRRTLVVADEVHHLGAPDQRTHLPANVDARLGLSATPERAYDETGTEKLTRYFGGIVFEYGLDTAIQAGHLTDYYYIPHFVELTDEEMLEYGAYTTSIANRIERLKASDTDGAELFDDPVLTQLLIERARIKGGAVQKFDRLQTILEQVESHTRSLVYCGDSTVQHPEFGPIRQIDAAVKLIGAQLDIPIHKFTYEESAATRQELLNGFADEQLQMLAAIRCLDEGVDVPAAHTAYLMASSKNPREFVQRRGRILRPAPGKTEAVIHDFVTIPPLDELGMDADSEVIGMEQQLFEGELARIEHFAHSALNRPDASLTSFPTSTPSLAEVKQRLALV